jgi:hypothetical protein
LRHLLERTDSTIRSFAEVLLRSGSEVAVQTGGLRDMLQASTQTLANATERIAGLTGKRADDTAAGRALPKPEAAE